MIEQLTLNNKCKIEELEKRFPQHFVDFPVNRQLTNSIFTEIFTISYKDEIIGFLTIDTIYERMELIQIEIDKQYQNKGYGQKLMDFMILEAKKRNVENITLEVNKENEIAIHIYQKYDFKIVAKRKNYYHGTDGILMERKMI